LVYHQPLCGGYSRPKAIPGHEFSGTVAGLGAGATGYSLGDAVFGFNDWFAEGATAEFCITEPSNLSLKPSSLSHTEAASALIGLLTAWQGLHLKAKLLPHLRRIRNAGRNFHLALSQNDSIASN
jgi:NADPH:quinone reductase-like Zn-dependent oxidoreductase